MKLAVLADVHACLAPLEAVLAEAERREVDGILVAGDLTIGPQQDEVLARLQAAGATMIYGNSDHRLLRYLAGQALPIWEDADQFEMLRWSARRLGAPGLALLKSLPEQRVIHPAGCEPIRMVHGSPGSPYEFMDPHRHHSVLEQALRDLRESVLVSGHTHQPFIYRMDGRLALNPGATCGGLGNGRAEAEFGLLEWRDGRWQAELRRAPFDFEMLRKAYRESGCLDEGGILAYTMLLTFETGQDVTLQFLDHAFALARSMGYGECRVVPNPAWRAARDSFPFERFNTRF